jgi:hypothetical protein
MGDEISSAAVAVHLLIGFLASALLAKRRAVGSRSPLLELSYPIRTLHLLPGRVRFEIPKLKGNAAACEQLATAIGRLEGVEGAEVNAVTGTVLIRFDAAKLEPELLVAALVRLLDLEHEMENPPPAAAGREMVRVARALDRAVYDRTGGLLDLRTALPIGLAGLGVYRLMARKGTALPAAATLIWWAYSFMRRGSGASAGNRR